jgi:aerobic-type carbon monoxide dehydrogenase small subunit (CoxS/CutS family)
LSRCDRCASFFDGKQIRTVEAHAKREEHGNVVALSAVHT